MFRKALPIYPKENCRKINTFAVFRTTLPDLTGAELHITAASFYRVSVNGVFAGFGPARTARGYARMDVLPLGDLAKSGENEIKIEVAGYYCHSMSAIFQPSFLQAEIVRGAQVLRATGCDFEAYLPHTRVQKTERYSCQRQFTEIWDLRTPDTMPVPTETVSPAPAVLPRVAPPAAYEDISLTSAGSRGVTAFDPTVTPHRNFYSHPIPPENGIFAWDEIPYHPYEWVQQRQQQKTAGETALPLILRENEYAIFDFSRVETGFLRLLAETAAMADVVIAFSEDADKDRFAFTDMHVHNVVELFLGAGQTTDFMTFEPYVCRYVMVAVKNGAITLKNFGIKTFEHETASVTIPPISDPVLRDIYRAAVRSFAHNAVDLYTDCPSRERAGWLCDSYFTGKTEYALFGEVPVEQAFLENYRLFRNNGEYADGDIIPMCYPSDSEDNGKFIPQWTMWFILEVEEYLNVRGHGAERELFRPVIERLLRFYRKFENADGLLEKLPSWNFVEWSAANKWTQDVNYPTNFLYAQVLECVGRIFEDDAFTARAAQVRRTAAAQSFDGRLFLDHAVRDENDALVLQKDCSEIAQYYAILFGGLDLTEPRYAELLRLIRDVFAAGRKEQMPDIEPINAFIGVYLRIETLLKLQEYGILLRDIADFFGPMVHDTGTLWEYRQRHGSRDHGFASYALVAMKKALTETGALPKE